MRVFSLLAGVALSLASVVSTAAEPTEVIRAMLTKLDPNLPVESITESPMPRLYQIQLLGGRQLYASADGQFLVQGYLYQLQGEQAVNLTERAENLAVAKQMAVVPMGDMVVFPAKSPKTQITVFTDTDCGYCQKLHKEVPELNRLGVEVRYMAYPRQGMSSATAQTLVSIWCADDRQDAMNKAKARQPVTKLSCDTPVAAQYELGRVIGVQATPTVVLADGQVVPGYQPAPQLAKIALAAAESAAKVASPESR